MRVFVFGAGASAHAGYPLTKELGPRLLDWAEGSSPPQNVLYWPVRAKLAQFGALDDIEGVVTRLEETRNSGVILAGLREGLCHFFQWIQPTEAKLYKEFAEEIVRPDDVLITFNYDISLELELKRAGKWEASNGYGFDLEAANIARSPTLLLKLHGSINWMDLLFDGLQDGQFSWPINGLGHRPVFPWGLDHLGYPGVTDPKWKRGGVDRAGSMILPSRKKKYFVETSVNPREREAFWGSLWTQAANFLGQADEIVIIGYSLPQADEESRNLLLRKSNRRATLSVCCGSESDRIIGELARSGFSPEKGTLYPRRFEEWIRLYSGRETSDIGVSGDGRN